MKYGKPWTYENGKVALDVVLIDAQKIVINYRVNFQWRWIIKCHMINSETLRLLLRFLYV
jgi:hypothetical protein